ncbi:hypothetical protein AK812_SmicGene26254 [Symbiodinium microadriaticum]|uniref:Ubiquitin-like domain-containing protein n=1 Tax=Symbiodinium microadriaticum TaxID=2951 RepID=A0A1Q9D9V9_SYMMI|nr:hypothetical protein AK812_SmicGene26254 [Symbiodinium microadriaticum]
MYCVLLLLVIVKQVEMWVVRGEGCNTASIGFEVALRSRLPGALPTSVDRIRLFPPPFLALSRAMPKKKPDHLYERVTLLGSASPLRLELPVGITVGECRLAVESRWGWPSTRLLLFGPDSALLWDDLQPLFGGRPGFTPASRATKKKRSEPSKVATVSKLVRPAEEEPSSFSAFMEPRSYRVRKSQDNRSEPDLRSWTPRSDAASDGSPACNIPGKTVHINFVDGESRAVEAQQGGLRADRERHRRSLPGSWAAVPQPPPRELHAGARRRAARAVRGDLCNAPSIEQTLGHSPWRSAGGLAAVLRTQGAAAAAAPALRHPARRELQVLVGEPPVPCVGIFAMLPALNRLSDTRPGEVLVASLPCFELKALQLPLLQHCGTLRELPLRLPQKPGLARSCAMLLGRLLRTKVGRRKLEEFRFQDGLALPLLLCDGEFLLRQAVIVIASWSCARSRRGASWCLGGGGPMRIWRPPQKQPCPEASEMVGSFRTSCQSYRQRRLVYNAAEELGFALSSPRKRCAPSALEANVDWDDDQVTHISVWITSPYAEPEVVDIEMSFPLEMQTVYDVALDSLQSRFDTTKLSHPVAVTPQLHHHFGSIMLLPDWVPLSEYYAMVIDARSIGKGLFSFYISSPLTRYAVSAQLGDVPNEAYDIYAFGSLDPLANLEQLPPIQAGLIQVVPRGRKPNIPLFSKDAASLYSPVTGSIFIELGAASWQQRVKWQASPLTWQNKKFGSGLQMGGSILVGRSPWPVLRQATTLRSIMSLAVDVHLLSGQRASMEVEADASVESLKHRALRALAVASRARLLNSSGEVLDGAQTVTEAKLKNGDVLTLHVVPVQLQGTKQGSRSVFAALLGDGSVVMWGNAIYGGDSRAVRDQLRDVQQIQASDSAFAAILGDGSVVTWGDAECGGDSSAVRDQLRNVQQVQASAHAFAAILRDGSVVSWGTCTPGDSNAVRGQLRDVQQIQACYSAFAAILGDGSVVTWGGAAVGGDSRAAQDQLRDVQQIQATGAAFAAILGDGSVVTWGYAGQGGDSSAVQDQLRDVQQIQASHQAFAAILADGSVVSWGHADYGGDSRAVQHHLRDVQQIQACYSAFAAILGDGSVVTWGNAQCGGDSRAVQDQLRDVQQIQASYSAFAAILGDGSVVTWGDAECGGDSSAVHDQLRTVQQIQASYSAFAAILADGSVITWGDARCGGDSSAVHDQLRDVQQIQATGAAFAAVLGDGSVVMWGSVDFGRSRISCAMYS